MTDVAAAERPAAPIKETFCEMEIGVVRRANSHEFMVTMDDAAAKHVFGTTTPEAAGKRITYRGNAKEGIAIFATASTRRVESRGTKDYPKSPRNRSWAARVYLPPDMIGVVDQYRKPTIIRGKLAAANMLFVPPANVTWHIPLIDEVAKRHPLRDAEALAGASAPLAKAPEPAPAAPPPPTLPGEREAQLLALLAHPVDEEAQRLLGRLLHALPPSGIERQAAALMLALRYAAGFNTLLKDCGDVELAIENGRLIVKPIFRPGVPGALGFALSTPGPRK